jgi:glycosyltransferase involved in cell wall biosynthesis
MSLIENHADIVSDLKTTDGLLLLNKTNINDQPMASRPTVSVIIPTLNEAKNLPLVLPYLPMNWVDEVVLVDGRSTDGTVEVAKKLLPTIKVVLEAKKGKGAAMRAGYDASFGDILIVIDADGSNDPREIPRYVTALLEGGDFVKGSRFAPGGGTTDMPRYRMLGNGFFVLLGNLFFSVKFTDLCYGYHAFWRYCLDAIQIESFQGFEIDTALYLQAAKARLRIVEVPSFEGYRFYGVGKLQTIPDGFRVLRTIFTVWANKMGESSQGLHLGFRGIKYARPGVFEDRPEAKLEETFAQRLMEFIRLLSIMMLTGSDTSQVIQRVLKLTLEAVNADSGSLILLDENGNVQNGCLASKEGFKMSDASAWSDVLNQGIAGWAIKNHQPVLILDTQEDPRWLQREWDARSRSAMALPLSIGGMVVGALTLVRQEDKKFTSDEFEKFTSLSE